MRISNVLITSVACFRKHFDFHAVWGQLGIFIRDMSPENVPYPDAASKNLYRAIKDPRLVSVINNQLFVNGENGENINPFSLNNSASLEMDLIKEENQENRIRILALFELAGQKMTQERLTNDSFSENGGNEVLIKNGHSPKVVEQDYQGLELAMRLIRVDSASLLSCVINGIEIHPGKYAYGVFSRVGLHRVLSPVAQNDVYLLRLSSTASGAVDTLVHNKLDGTQCHLHNVHSFCVLGKDNYAYVENEKVYCHHNEILSKRIESVVSLLDSPLFIQMDDDMIIITMKDGSVKFVNIK